MRHGKKVNHLSRQTGHRKSMLANMACSLIEHKRIITTVAKAKALKQFVEPLVTKSKEDTTHNRRVVFAYLRNKYGVTELFREVAAKVGDRPGGYTRIIKMGNRLGDNADMAMIELVDFNELYNGGKKEEKKGRTRRAKKSTETTIAPKATAQVIEEVEPIVDEAATVVEEVVETPADEVETPEFVEDAPAAAEVEETQDVLEEAPAVIEVEESAESVEEVPAVAEVEQTPTDETPEAPATDEESKEEEA
jgi:large subunit ribosomal protein L17